MHKIRANGENGKIFKRVGGCLWEGLEGGKEKKTI